MADRDVLGSQATLLDSGKPTRADDAAKPATGIATRATVLPRVVPTGASDAPPSNAPRYEPIRFLGKGGVGEVTLARDNDIDRPVAVKRLRADAQSSEGLHRFVHEIRTVGQLEHPNIAPIHDVGIDDDGQHYFVMRYVDGETLETIIAKLAAGDRAYHERFTFEHRVQIFLGILHAIQYAHAKTIVHRDIKPSNIMIGPYGEVVVMDWGIAKKRDADVASADAVALAATLDGAGGDSMSGRDSMFRTRHGSLVGTPAYMSPEQAGGRTSAIDERSDIYSLCAVFYELLALRHYLPDRTTIPEMLASVMKDKQEHASHVVSPHQPPPPAELGWFIETGLEKDPKKRYQSVDKMIDTLQRILAGGFAVQCYVTLMKKGGGAAVRFMDQHPRLAAAAIIATLGLVGFAMIELIVIIARG
jgi:serine/threonine-protein kinase